MKTLRPPSLLTILVLALGLLLPAFAQARYMMPQLRDVPIKRLIANLEEQVKSSPRELHLPLNLARAHAMAYALNSDDAEVEVNVRGGGMGFWHVPFGYSPEMPHAVASAPSSTAREHLARAIKLYEGVMDMQLKDSKAYQDHYFPVARLGRAWCLEQSGEKEAAIAEYRILVQHTRPGSGHIAPDTESPQPGIDWSDVAAEASGYLIALLDPKRDAAEIASLKQQFKLFAARPRPITPIAIPLKAGTQLSEIEDAGARVAFDVDAKGTGRHWSWITPKAGWLIYDPRQTGKIDSGIRLFGNVTFWMFWQNGYQALATLDDDRDGTLDNTELTGIAVWIDRNRNGSCEPGEVASLAELNIAALRYAHTALPNHPDRIVYAPQGVQFKDGSSAASYDIVLHPKP
jgi:hypothetical protein